MSQTLLTVSYLAATILFVLSLGGLSSPETSRRGNLYGMIGMAIAVLATVLGPHVTKAAYPWIVGAMLVGAVIGLYAARVVKMTQMPELVALMHSLVGLVAVLVGFANHIDPAASAGLQGAEETVHKLEIYVGVLIGAVTFSGSLIAFGKLSAKISGKPVLLPGRHWINLAGLLAVIWCGGWFVGAHSVDEGLRPLAIMTLIALLFGVHMVMAIGGADMPVVVSMLNSYSGWAAAATGFMLGNDLLIVTGALVGSSGAILSYIMCRAMNRNFVSVIAGGVGTGGAARGLRDHQAAARKRRERALRHPSGGRPHARPHERAAGGGEGALRHRDGDGRDQPGLPRHRRRDGDRRQRHREPGGAGGPVEPDRRDAGARGMEGEELDHHEAQHGLGLRRRRQSALLQGQQPDAVRRRQEDAGRSPGIAKSLR